MTKSLAWDQTPGSNHSTHVAQFEHVDKVTSAVEKKWKYFWYILRFVKSPKHYVYAIVIVIGFDWFKIYLENRKQFVGYHSRDSKTWHERITLIAMSKRLQEILVC